MPADRCGFCGSTDGPFTRVEGLFTVLMCPACLAKRARGRGPYPDLSDEEMRAGLDLLPTWVLEQKAAANRQVIAVMRGRLERGSAWCRCMGRWGLPGWVARPTSPNSSSAPASNHPPPHKESAGSGRAMAHHAGVQRCCRRLWLLELLQGLSGGSRRMVGGAGGPGRRSGTSRTPSRG
jgi:hypothetical protein